MNADPNEGRRVAFGGWVKDAAVGTLVETGSEGTALEAVATLPDPAVTDKFLRHKATNDDGLKLPLPLQGSYHSSRSQSLKPLAKGLDAIFS